MTNKKGCIDCKHLEIWDKGNRSRRCFREWLENKRVQNLTKEMIEKGCNNKVERNGE